MTFEKMCSDQLWSRSNWYIRHTAKHGDKLIEYFNWRRCWNQSFSADDYSFTITFRFPTAAMFAFIRGGFRPKTLVEKFLVIE